MNLDVGKLIILSGPSGAGKSTIVERLLTDCPLPLRRSVSATTRRPRPGEQDGVHYHFLSHDEFTRLRQEDAFLECKEVFGRGDWYGTLRSEVATGQQAGQWVLLEIDVEGAQAVVDQVPDAITIFLHPGPWEELERRLRGRGTESDESFRRRLDVAQAEMRRRDWYRFEVINDTVERAVAEICAILRRCGD